MLERFCKWMDKHIPPTQFRYHPVGHGPLTEGKTRGNVKEPGVRLRPTAGPPAPTPKFRPLPYQSVTCKWIEVYVPDPKGFHDGCNIEHHDEVKFWVDSSNNLVIYKGLGKNTVTYHEYRKYVTRGEKYWG